MSAKVITTPSTRLSWVRYGRMRRVYHAPSSLSTSRFGGTLPARTALASASRRASLMRRARSASGLPMSEAMTLNIDLAAGVKKTDLGVVHGVLQVVGGGALALDGFVELTVEGGELLVERLQLFLGSLQFFVGRVQFFVDGHRLFVGGRQFVIGCLEVVDCALQFLAGGIEFLLELDDMRRVGGLGPFLAAFLALGFVREADQKKLFILGVKRPDRDALRYGIAVTVHLRAPDCDAGMLLAGLADRRPELHTQSVARHSEEIPTGLARSHLQVAVDRPEIKEALVLGVDEDRGRCMDVEQHLSGEVTGPCARRGGSRPA